MWSRVCKRQLEADYVEFPADWYEGLDADDLLTRPEYENAANRYGVKAGQTIQEWEAAGWIRPIGALGDLLARLRARSAEPCPALRSARLVSVVLPLLPRPAD